MNDGAQSFRASGYYGTYAGREYRAWRRGDHVRLFSDDDPLPAGFEPSARRWVRGEKQLSLNELQRLVKVHTTAQWCGYPFEIGTRDEAARTVAVTYLGGKFGEVSSLPGMSRPDKYEVVGTVLISELTDIVEQVEEVPGTGE